jgi:hypothetical protein
MRTRLLTLTLIVLGACRGAGMAPISGMGGVAGATAGAPGTGGVPGTGGGSGGAPGTGGSAGAAGAGGSGGAPTGSCTTFLDAAGGDDAQDGASPATAWKTLDKVNGVTFQPGNRLCLKAGSSWTGQLAPKGSGSSDAPIVIDRYGTGALPLIAAGTADSAVYLLNQQYWEINNLEVTNKKSALGDVRGISINGQNGGTLSHIYIRNCFVHDVTGQVNWIGGDTANNAPGVTFQTGWDDSKKTGGIVFDVQAAAGAGGSTAAVKTRFDDIRIEDNDVQDCSFGGIILKQLDGSVHWGTRSSATDKTWTPHTNVTIRGNHITQLGSDYACDGIYLTDTQVGLIEDNVIQGAGTSAIELYYTDAVTVQHNETFATTMKAGGADANGVDTDKGTTKTIIQYNYFHENGDGILICQFSFGDSVIRYNIIQNSSRYQIYLHSDPAASSAIYNNTVYNSKTNSGVVYGYGTALNATYTLTDNIFFAAAGNGVLTTSSGIAYQNNLYAGSSVTAPATDAKAIKADPKLTAAGSGPDGYKLQAGSPAIDTGAVVPDSGASDFWGDPLYTGAPDIGAYEAP